MLLVETNEDDINTDMLQLWLLYFIVGLTEAYLTKFDITEFVFSGTFATVAVHRITGLRSNLWWWVWCCLQSKACSAWHCCLQRTWCQETWRSVCKYHCNSTWLIWNRYRYMALALSLQFKSWAKVKAQDYDSKLQPSLLSVLPSFYTVVMVYHCSSVVFMWKCIPSCISTATLPSIISLTNIFLSYTVHWADWMYLELCQGGRHQSHNGLVIRIL